MSDATEQNTDERARFTGRYLATRKLVARQSAATLRMIILRPAFIAYTGPGLLVLLALAVGLMHAVAGRYFPIAAVLVVAFLLVVWAGTLFLIYRMTCRKAAQLIPIGSVYTIELRSDSLVFSDALEKREVSYGSIESVRRHGHLIWLWSRSFRTPTFLPIELFTPESLIWLRSRLRSAAGSPATDAH